jgi:outer membrane protein OmpA-like peptidoglycan-associated protein
MLLGAAAVSLRGRLPTIDLAFQYDAGALKSTLAARPVLSIEIKYNRARLNAILARLYAPPIDAKGGPKPPEAVSVASPAAGTGSEARPALSADPETGAARATAATPDGGVSVDFSRIAPDGTSVLAGRAAPGSSVTVFEKDKPIGTVTAGPDGEWSLSTEHRFSSDAPEDTLRAVEGTPKAQTPPVVAKAEVGTETPSTEPADRVGPSKKNEVPAVGEAKTELAEPPAQSPAARLVSEFERTVRTAREEARSAAGTVQEKAANPRGANVSVSPKLEDATESLAPVQADRDQPPAPEIIPVPMQFVYREATLTDDGRHAFSLLLEYVKIKNFGAVTLSGHADERGGPDYNMDLSRERLEAIERLLRAGGYGGKIELLPKGESEPFSGVDRTHLPLEELMQLDRRVELRVAQ